MKFVESTLHLILEIQISNQPVQVVWVDGQRFGRSRSHGQARANLSAQVPFDFIVASKDFRAGEYNVRAITNAGDAILISTADKKIG